MLENEICVLTISLDSNSRDSDKTCKDGEEQRSSPEVIPLWFIDFEGLFESGLVVGKVALRS